MASSTVHCSHMSSGDTFASELRRLAMENQDAPAYIFFDLHFNKTILSRQDVWDKSRKLAAILHRHGVQKGDIVCNTLVNSPERVLSTFGTLLAGAVSMHGQLFLADGDDLIHNCKVAKCRLMIVDPGQAKGALGILDRIQYKDEKTGETRYAGLPDLETVIHFRACTNADEDVPKRGLFSLEEEKEMFEETDIKEGNTAFIFCTSGTTGFSKLVAYTHGFCLTVARSLATVFESKNDRSFVFNMNSLGWLGGFPGLYPSFGVTRVLTDMSRGVPEAAEKLVLKIFNEVNIDSGIVAPVMLSKLIGLVRSGAKIGHRARVLLLTGTCITKDLMDAIGHITDSLYYAYGMTECVSVATMLYEEGTMFEGNCVGKLGDGVVIKVLDEKLNELPRGKIGQLAVKTRYTMEGYVNSPEKTKECFTEDGFFLSGDLGYLDNKSYLFVFGRQADTISRGVFIHYPGWMETRIEECPGVESVAVIGIPDPVYHEEICACVIPSKTGNLTIEQLKEFCSGLLLTEESEDISATIKYFLLFEFFPYNPNSKLDRKMLRAEACQRLGVEDNRQKR